MSYLAVPTSQSRFSGSSSEGAAPISPYYRDFDFGNLLSKWTKQDEFSRDNSPPSARLDPKGGDSIPCWSERDSVQQMYGSRDMHFDTTPSWHESNSNTNSAVYERNGSILHGTTDLKQVAKQKLIQSGGFGSGNIQNGNTITWRYNYRNDDINDVSSYSSIDSISDVSHTSLTKNPMNYWTPIGARTSSNVTSNTKSPRNTSSRSSEERGTRSKIAHQIATRQSPVKPVGDKTSNISKPRMNLSANAKSATSKSVSPQRQDTFNSEDSNAEDDEEVLNDGKMRYVYKMTSLPANTNSESANSAKTSGRERVVTERSRADVKKQFVQNSIAISQSDSSNKAAKHSDGKITKTINVQSQKSPRNLLLDNGRQNPSSAVKETPKSSYFGDVTLNGNKANGHIRSSTSRNALQQKTEKAVNDVTLRNESVSSTPKNVDEASEKRSKLVSDLQAIQDKTPFTNQKWFQIETLKLALQNAAFYPNYYRVELEKHAADLCKEKH